MREVFINSTPIKKATQFVRDERELQQALKRLKQRRCVHCRRVGTLNRHDKVYGNDPSAADKQVKRGQRVWCSNRGKRGGCGRTTAIVFAWVLPRHSWTASLLSRLLKGIGRGESVQRAWQRTRSGLSLQGAYHLLQRLRRRLGPLRTALLGRCPPPASPHQDPLRQTVEHLRCAFSGHEAPVAAYQYLLARPLMG